MGIVDAHGRAYTGPKAGGGHNDLRIAVVFYTWPKNGNRITVGFPEQFPAPIGAVKNICRTAKEVEKWDARLRQQEKDDAEKSAEERERTEGPLVKYMNDEFERLRVSARDNKNREFMDASAKLLAAKRQAREKAEKANFTEGVMHLESHEQGSK